MELGNREEEAQKQIEDCYITSAEYTRRISNCAFTRVSFCKRKGEPPPPLLARTHTQKNCVDLEKYIRVEEKQGSKPLTQYSGEEEFPSSTNSFLENQLSCSKPMLALLAFHLVRIALNPGKPREKSQAIFQLFAAGNLIQNSEFLKLDRGIGVTRICTYSISCIDGHAKGEWSKREKI